MFTKCPECNISFRVTAKVLQQANGNVRCGGCSHAFNALNYLSEEMPASALADDASQENDQLAETSRRLLETLDELAGPDDVLIEDTGVEWRVLDKNDAGVKQEEVNVTEEMRYDDSTLLPDDFGREDDDGSQIPEPGRRAGDGEAEKTAEIDAAQQDLLLSEPGDWTELLDEVSDAEPETDSLEVEEELAAIHTQLSTRESPSTEDFGTDNIDAQFNTQAEAMGLDLTSSENALTDQFPLLNEETIVDAAAAGEIDNDDEVDGEIEDDVVDLTVAEDDATGEFSTDSLQEDSEDLKADNDDVADEDSLAEAEADELVDSLAATADEESAAEDALPDSEAEFAEDEELESEFESTGEFPAQIDVAARALSGDDNEDGVEDESDENGALDADGETSGEEDPFADEPVDLELDSDITGDVDSAEVEHIVPNPTEDEMTVNKEIDQEMMAMAIQDDDFAATLVGLKNPEELFEENAADVETIIMEGEFIRGSVEKERLAAENAAKSQLDDPASLVDTYAMRRGKVRGGRRRYDPAGYGITIAIVVLIVTLAGQFIHNSRETLATVGLFTQTIAPVYRLLGSPVTPSWDIKGWQFEVTNGSVDEAETTLTIVSRIVNRGEQSLPYPLVHVSLIDRWEEIKGSRILAPNDYLAGDLDPSSLVQPGENFTAVIAIEEPAEDATGFRLRVCYRVSPETVRCADQNFKN